MSSRYLEDLTWPEAERALLELPTVLLPLGARTKEHGRHLPLNNDWLLAEYLARRVAAECPVLVLPTVQYGYYPAFLEYPGSISLRADVFRDAIVDICQSLIPHGARRFYVLNTGISTIPPLQAARASIIARGARFEFTDIRTEYAPLRRSIETQPAGTHADELETSMMLYIAPDVVRLHLAQRDIHPDRGPGGLHRDPAATAGVYSPTGAYGDPTLATRDKGQRLVEGMVAQLISAIRNLSAQSVAALAAPKQPRAPATEPAPSTPPASSAPSASGIPAASGTAAAPRAPSPTDEMRKTTKP